MKKNLIFLLICFFLVSGCENTNLYLLFEAGLDAFRAATLSEADVQKLASAASRLSDSKNRIMPADDPYAIRLRQLTAGRTDVKGTTFDIKVYKSDEINAFAMADGTIRIYTGLMDFLSDPELFFVVGHEIGHVTQRHIRKKIALAYAAGALRKGIASQENLAGDIARSPIGGLAQSLINAKFSQAEEKEADDEGFEYIRQHGVDVSAAVSALKKLDTLGKSHTFLSSHPDPALRAKRLQDRIDRPDAKPESPWFFEKPTARIKDLLDRLGSQSEKK